MNGWSGNIIEPGPYVSDGYILLREDYTDRHLMRYLRRLHPKGSPACASQTQAAALWKITGRRAVVPLEWIGQIALTRGSCGRATRPLILDRFKRDAARRPMPTVEIDSEKRVAMRALVTVQRNIRQPDATPLATGQVRASPVNETVVKDGVRHCARRSVEQAHRYAAAALIAVTLAPARRPSK